ncbi:hypothetical protein AVEN_76981-1 [Araneus ventricosus]|uniref:Nose resistant to fluoxetine protein 6 n=1 Tax=Araneus ventricosus TaxID=182803 RepID=A0A4Y2MB83_ARAVE|nr:hypothetical protein AVEN_76981-1 [Araneus ventricosus]
MDVCPQNSFGAHPWQATLSSIMMELKDEFELANSTNALCHQPDRKKLTTEALFMLFVILLFVILTLIRSALSVYERCKATGKETHSSISERKEKAADGTTYAEEENKLLETSIYAVFLTNLKRILDCFCIKSNARRILSTVSTQEQLSSLHGIRAIIVIWVLLGHVSMLYVCAVKSPDKVQLTLDLQGTQIIKNTIFIVDTFLVLSSQPFSMKWPSGVPWTMPKWCTLVHDHYMVYHLCCGKM